MAWDTTLKRKILRDIQNGMTAAHLARQYDIGERTVYRWIRELKDNPDLLDGVEVYAPDSHNVKGVSTYIDSEGNVKGQWIKTKADEQKRWEAAKEAIHAMCETIEPVAPAEFVKQCHEDLLSFYVVTDYHLNMLAEKSETGGDWNLEIAENTLVNFIAQGIQSAPDADTAVLCQLGDFMHNDSMEAVTPTHRHQLDVSCRPNTAIKAAVRVLRKVVTLLLGKHKKVHIVMADANHDPYSSICLRTMFEALYEDEPRVTVDTSDTTYYCYEWGETSLFMHHGHKSNMGQVSKVFVGEYREVFGRTKHSFAHLGHFHHSKKNEDNLMIVEVHPTLAARDAHAANSGYRSRRSASVITYHKTHGEVGRCTFTPDMLVT